MITLKKILVLFIMSLPVLMLAQTETELVKKRVLHEILQQAVDDAIVSSLIQTMQADGSWPHINYEDVSRTGFENRYHLQHMEVLSLAYRKKSSSFYNDRKIRKALIQSLTYWCDHDFISDNWYYNQVYTPLKLVNVLLLMDGLIEPELKNKALQITSRAHMNAPGARPGADRIRIGAIAAKRGLLLDDNQDFAEIMKVMNDQIAFNTGGRGMQQDYSFHHRYTRVNTTYSYGGSYADVCAEWAAYTAGTRYEFAPHTIEQLIDYYLDGICKQAVYGIYLEKGAMNRSIARMETFEPISTATPKNLLKVSNYREDELKEIIALREGKQIPAASFAKFFWQSEHFVFQRPSFFTSVRMFSTRNMNMEYPHNSEGILNHHRGEI